VKSLRVGLAQTVVVERQDVGGRAGHQVRGSAVRCRPHRDVLPLDDYSLRKAYAKGFSQSVPCPPQALEKHGEKWRPYRTVASWYLCGHWRRSDGLDFYFGFRLSLAWRSGSRSSTRRSL